MSGFRYRLQPDDITARDTVQDLTMLFATGALVFGLFLLTQPNSIWNLDVYDSAKTLPGSPDSWGAILMTGSILMFAGMWFGRRYLMLLGTMVAAAWNFFFALALLPAAIDGKIGYSSVGVYVVIFLVHVIIFVTYRKGNADAV